MRCIHNVGIIAVAVLLNVSCASGEHQIGPVADETISPMETVEWKICPIDGESPRMLSAATKLLFAEDKYVILAGNMPFAVGKDGKILKQMNFRISSSSEGIGIIV